MKKAFVAGVVLLAGLSGAAFGEGGAGNLKYSISVSKFENKANWSGRWDLGDAFGTIMTEAQFIQAVGFSSVLPGSDALQLAMFVGYTAAGVPGAVRLFVNLVSAR